MVGINTVSRRRGRAGQNDPSRLLLVAGFAHGRAALQRTECLRWAKGTPGEIYVVLHRCLWSRQDTIRTSEVDMPGTFMCRPGPSPSLVVDVIPMGNQGTLPGPICPGPQPPPHL